MHDRRKLSIPTAQANLNRSSPKMEVLDTMQLPSALTQITVDLGLMRITYVLGTFFQNVHAASTEPQVEEEHNVHSPPTL